MSCQLCECLRMCRYSQTAWTDPAARRWADPKPYCSCHAQVEERLRFYEEGIAPTKNITAMQVHNSSLPHGFRVSAVRDFCGDKTRAHI